MAKKFTELRSRMSPEAQARSAARAEAMQTVITSPSVPDGKNKSFGPFHMDDVEHTVIIGPTGAGMSVLSDALVEECKRHGAKPGVEDVGYSYSRAKED